MYFTSSFSFVFWGLENPLLFVTTGRDPMNTEKPRYQGKVWVDLHSLKALYTGNFYYHEKSYPEFELVY